MSMHITYLKDHDGHKAYKDYFVERTLARRLCENGVALPYVTYAESVKKAAKDALEKKKADLVKKREEDHIEKAISERVEKGKKAIKRLHKKKISIIETDKNDKK